MENINSNQNTNIINPNITYKKRNSYSIQSPNTEIFSNNETYIFFLFLKFQIYFCNNKK